MGGEGVAHTSQTDRKEKPLDYIMSPIGSKYLVAQHKPLHFLIPSKVWLLDISFECILVAHNMAEGRLQWRYC